jgi:hypothetical protein
MQRARAVVIFILLLMLGPSWFWATQRVEQLGTF